MTPPRDARLTNALQRHTIHHTLSDLANCIENTRSRQHCDFLFIYLFNRKFFSSRMDSDTYLLFIQDRSGGGLLSSSCSLYSWESLHLFDLPRADCSMISSTNSPLLLFDSPCIAKPFHSLIHFPCHSHQCHPPKPVQSLLVARDCSRISYLGICLSIVEYCRVNVIFFKLSVNLERVHLMFRVLPDSDAM